MTTSKLRRAALYGSLLGAVGLFGPICAQAAPITQGTYALSNHSDGGAQPPLYGLRLDGLLTGDLADIYTFDFDHVDSNMKLTWDGTTVHIFGSAFGGQDADSGNGGVDGNNDGYVDMTTAVWSIDFSYSVGGSEVANGGLDDIVFSSDHVNSGTLSSAFGLYEMREHAKVSTGVSFVLGDGDGSGHRGEPFAGWGWTDTRMSGEMDWFGSDDGCCNDWLFSASPVPVPAPAVLLVSGLIGLAGLARRRA